MDESQSASVTELVSLRGRISVSLRTGFVSLRDDSQSASVDGFQSARLPSPQFMLK